MKMIHIPSSCPKCDNKVSIERLDNKNANVFCKHCDFILPIDESELKFLEQYMLVEHN